MNHARRHKLGFWVLFSAPMLWWIMVLLVPGIGTVDDLKQQIATHAKRKQDAKKLSDDLAAAIKAKETAETEAAAAKDAVKETEARLEGLQKSSEKTKHELA